jgi:hypothetical protein
MAIRAESDLSIIKAVNGLLFSAWEHGARHMALHARPDGTEVRFLAADGGEHIDYSPLPYELAVERLQAMCSQGSRIRVNAAGQHWHLDLDLHRSHRREGVFLHLRPDDEP